MSNSLVLRSAGSRVEVDLSAGGRIASLTVDGLEVLGRAGKTMRDWGSFVMAPYAGRVRNAILTVNGVDHGLDPVLPPHAGHGVVYDAPWRVSERRGAAGATLECDLDARWPFGGRVVHRLSLEPRALESVLEVHADSQPFPAMLGWHPWFKRHLDRGGPVQIRLTASAMLAKDAEGITTPVRVDIPAGPWDDCFVDPTWPVSLSWDGALRLQVTSDAPVVVVFDGKAEAVCVEPMSAPPNAINTNPTWVRPGEPLALRQRWNWVTD